MGMMADLKRKSVLTAVLSFFALTLCAAVLLVLVQGYRMFELLEGPAEITEETSIGELEGKYAELEVSDIYWDYMAVESLREGQASGTGEIVRTDYVVLAPDGGTLFGLAVYESKSDAFFAEYNAYVEAWNAAYEQDGDQMDASALLARPPRVTGSIVPMESEDAAFFNEAFDELEIPREYASYYLFDTGRIGGMEYSLIIGTGIAGTALFLFGFFLLLGAVIGRGQRDIVRYCDENGGREAEERLERWYESSETFGGIRAGSGFFMVQRGIRQRLYPESEIVWVYQHTVRRNGVPSHSAVLGTVKKKLISVPMRDKKIAELLAYITGNCPGVAAGYLPELASAFREDPAELLAIARRRSETDESQNLDDHANPQQEL